MYIRYCKPPAMNPKWLRTLLFPVLLLTAAVHAQTVATCATDQMYRLRARENPAMAAAELELQRQITAQLTHMDISKYAKTTATDTEYHIPVVVHVVHDYGNSLSSDCNDTNIIKSIAQLNEVFNKKNADTADVIGPYKGLIPNSDQPYIGNARIKWHLATKDPDGRPTTGITHTRSYMAKNASDLTKLEQWPQDQYLNIWCIDQMRPDTINSNAYTYTPAMAAAAPYWDGMLIMSLYLKYNNTVAHELGHYLALDHTFGPLDTDPSPVPAPWFIKDCGDDVIDDTPPNKGHLRSLGCSPAVVYDTACIHTTVAHMLKLSLDGSAVRKTDTATVKGIRFRNRTASHLDSIAFYPSAPAGSVYTIGLSRDGVLLSTKNITTTVVDARQSVKLDFEVPAAPATTLFQLHFTANPGAWRDSVTPALSGYPRGINGSILLEDASDDSMYNFFYDWSFHYGYFRIYGADSLVDYPDTVNAQNIMDLGTCPKMFTYGQTQYMRAALNSTVGNRNKLSDPANLARTGALDPVPAMPPKADYAVKNAAVVGASSSPAYFLCADDMSRQFQFMNYSWRAPATGILWIMPPGASTASSASMTIVKSTFKEGWNEVSLVASNANGSDTFTSRPGVYAAGNTAINPVGYYQEFNPGGDLDKWPIFNYYNNRYQWELRNDAGYFDKTSIRYRSYDNRSPAESITGDPNGDYDDFYSVAFDLSSLGSNANLNFRYAGAYTTSDPLEMKDSLDISYSTNCGATWNKLGSITGPRMQTAAAAVTGKEYVPENKDWKILGIDLKTGTTAIRDSKVFFRFRFLPYGTFGPRACLATGNNFYIDRINISNDPVTVNEMILGERQLMVSPNPTNGNAFVLFRAANASVTVSVTDVTGKAIFRTTEQVTGRDGRIEIPAPAIQAKGLYLVHIIGDGGLRQTEKLIVY